MRILFYLIAFLYSLASFSQGEANIWYFGDNAGLNFSSGSPVALTNGQLSTREGCAVLSTNLGQLLFYTDGVTVYNKNHQIMVNGAGLLGHPSSAQSATIVPKPGSGNLFYIFTTTNEHNPDGFRYSIVDMTLDGGNGAITTNKNIVIFTPTIENISITKHANGLDYWIISHEWNSNTFRVYLLSSTGLSATPVYSSVGLPVQGAGFQAAGVTKVSPSGSKLAMTSTSDFLQLFDFDNATGIISNPITLSEESGELYGIEFSPNEEVLYASNSFPGKLYQYDLTASNIANSQLTLINGGLNLGQLQMGPDFKIYVAIENNMSLSVINNPDIIGLGCDLQLFSVSLNGKNCRLGLPCFSQSFFFVPTIQLQNACVGESTSFQLNNSAVTSATWNFGDGGSSTLLNPSHSYATAGTYTVSVVATSPSGTGTNTRDIIISEVPNATQPNEIKICDTNNDGFASFDLTQNQSAILNGQSATQNQIKYFASSADYTSNSAIATPSTYTNSVAFGLQTIVAEVSNLANSNCKATTNFTIQVFKTAVAPNAPLQAIRLCDNTSFGTDADGKVVFDLTQNQVAILNGQSSAEFSVSYYTDSGFLNLITTPTNYINTNAVETIYVKISTIVNTNCFATTSFEIQVYSLPIVNATISLKQCDDDNDGFSAFNLTEANQLLVSNTTGLTFSFFETFSEAQNNSNPITNTISYLNQTVSNDQVFVRVINANGCFRVVSLNLLVSTTSIPVSFQKTFSACDNLASGSITDGISSFDFSSVTADVQALFPTGQLLSIAYYKNLADALAEQNAITNISNYSNIGYPNSQNIYIRVDSQVNNECLGLGHHITLTVEPIPIVQAQTIKHCDDDQDGFYSFNTSSVESNLLNGLTNVNVIYTDSNGILLSNPFPNPFSTTSQTINVTVKNNYGEQCEYNTTISFIVDDLPEAFTISTNLTTVCDDEINPAQQNGLFPFNTNTFQNTILGSQTGMIVNYFDANNVALSSPLPNPFISGSQNIRVEVVNPVNTTCKAMLYIPLVVNPNPLINLIGNELICSDNPTFTKTLDAGLLNPATQNNYTYTWFLNNVVLPNETNYSLIVNTAGIYTVKVESQNGCTSTRTITVIASNSAVIENIVVNDLSNSNSIEIVASGLGDYVYSLNNGAYQESSVFSPVVPGVYIVSVQDLKGCSTIYETVYVMGIPKFFTPNGDGFNEVWNINNLNPTINLKVNIFDRYGKLLSQFNPKNKGWDGNFNGQTLPATDYWYSVEFENGRVVKGHFSLLR
jgi:gliding motility-associated-like protein